MRFASFLSISCHHTGGCLCPVEKAYEEVKVAQVTVPAELPSASGGVCGSTHASLSEPQPPAFCLQLT